MSIFGIDLGTTYSAIAYVDETGRPTIVQNTLDDSSNTMPSVVFFNGEDIEVGPQAKESIGSAPGQTVSFVKREMANADFSFTPTGGSRSYNAIEISGFILAKIAQYAEAATGETVKQVVITIPAYFGDLERRATIEAGKFCGLDVLRLLNEPVAAAIAFSEGNPKAAKGKVMVFDLGGGTFDVAIVDLEKKEVICKGGDKFLGGKDWDEAVVKKLFIPKWQAGIKEKGGTPLSEEEIINNPVIYNTWMLKAEQAKINLSGARGVARVSLEAEGFGNFSTEINRADFDEATEFLLDRTINMTRAMLSEAAEKEGVSEYKYDKILLVGGSTKMPQVAERLEKEFGLKPVINDPALAVAKGAAIFADQLDNGVVTDPPLSDVFGKTYGTITEDRATNERYSASMLLKQQPLSQGTYTNTFYPKHDNQSGVLFEITESDSCSWSEEIMKKTGGEAIEARRVDLLETTVIGEVTLSLPPNTSKDEAISVTFSLTENQTIRVFACLKNKPDVQIEATIEPRGIAAPSHPMDADAIK